MSLKSKLINLLDITLHGKYKPLVAKIHYLYPNQRLVGKKILITGGGKGIGFAMAKRFKAEGAEVVIAGRNETTLRESANKLDCKYLVLDVCKTENFEAVWDSAGDLLEGVNCLVSNAGISLHEDGFLDVKPDQFDSQFDTNLKGAFFLTQTFIRKSVKNQEQTKNILFVSSETGITVDERPYGLSKAALNSLVQGLAYRYVNEGYRINAMAPGVTITDMIGMSDDSDLNCGYNLTKRYYLPDEMAEVACFLLSDASNCLNGQILVCNEGKTINARWK